MMKHHNLTLTTMRLIQFSVISTLLLLSSSAAVSDEDQAVARKLRASGQILSLEKIYELAKAIKPGEILETELEKKRDRYVYEVELLDKNGQVWEVKLDAKTGQLIKLENED
jgi:uncharacterized membrane protein YkoI